MRLIAYLWLAVAALLLAGTFLRFYPEPPLETDLLALLPPTERHPLAEEAASRLGRLMGERAVFLVGGRDAAEARAAAAHLAQALTDTLLQADDARPKTRVFETVISRVATPDPTTLLDLYTPFRVGLVAPDRRTQTLTANSLTAQLDARLATPFGSGVLPLMRDPFGDFDAWLQALPYQQFKLSPEEGWLMARGEGRIWVMVSGELAGSAFDPIMQRAMQTSLAQAEAALQRHWPGVQVLRAGAVFHASAARESAERDMHLITLGSLIGILFLLLLVYRSPGPLALGLLSVGVGMCAAVLATVTVFGHLHLMTLVFGASLIGEAIDYAIQYFSARLGAGPTWDAQRGLKSVFPALSIALATSVVGYAALAFTPFPAMRQIAVFAIVGLSTAWTTVVLLLPWLLTRPQSWTPTRLLDQPARWLALWRSRMSARTFMALTLLALPLAIPGWMKLGVDDDVRQLIQPPPELAAQEKTLRRLTGMEAGSQFFLVEGRDAEQVLQREETLALVLSPVGVKLQGLSRFVPSCRQQAADRQRLREALPQAREALETLGFRSEAATGWIEEVKSAEGCLTPDAWLASPLSAPFRHLWLGRQAGGYASLAIPSGYQNVAALAAGSGLPGITLVDKPGAVSRLFARYRHLGGFVLCAATTLIFVVLAWRYGARGAFAVLTPVLLGQGMALAILGYAGVALNLFNLLALLLVLGVGINYALFLYEGARGEGRREAAALVGVILSALTTLLSFGLLGLSSMPALHGFGITLSLGVSIAALLAPAALTLSPRPPPETASTAGDIQP